MATLRPEEIEARKKQHAEIKAEYEKRTVANADNLDKSILTYSSAGLAFSLGFLKDFVPIKKAEHACLLYTSWLLFVVAVVVTLVSYLLSQSALLKQLEISERYNLDQDDAALTEPNCLARILKWLSYLSTLSFLSAISTSTLFVALNLTKGELMQNTPTERINEGAPVPNLQKIPDAPFQRGAPVPIIQPIPTNNSPSSSPAPSQEKK
jgi:hypothetical protein